MSTNDFGKPAGAPKGAAVQDVINSKGKARVQDILAVKSAGLSVEEARQAMIAAGEAPVGNPNEAKPAEQKTSDLQTRWDKGMAKRNPSTTVRADYTPRPKTDQAVTVTAQDVALTVKISVSDGQKFEFTVPNQIALIREVKKFQAKLQAVNSKLSIADRLSAEVTYSPVGSSSVETISVETEPQKKEEVQPRGEGGSVANEPETERTENSKFILEIFRDSGEWVGRITYKNGAGTEEFRADTRRSLDMKLLEGKAHATLKVREVLRRDTFHDDLDKVYDIPGYSQEAFDALTPEAQGLVIDSLSAKAALEFLNDTPQFYGTDTNRGMILSFLHKRNLPVTVKNLSYAFEELADDLEQRPQPKVSVEVKKSAEPSASAVVADSTPIPVVTAPASAAVPTPAPTPVVRTRGSFGLKPGYTSSAPELEEPEEGNKPTEPSEIELRNMPLEQLQKLARKGYKQPRF